MWPFTKTVKEAPWRANGLDIISDDLDDYCSPHQKLVVSEVTSLVQPDDREFVHIAGGFAACVAGITKEYGDVDIFCRDSDVYDRVSCAFIHHVLKEQHADESTGYGRLTNVELQGVNYQIIEAHKRGECIERLLSQFDINWCMAGIKLDTQTLHVHKDAMSDKVMINTDDVRVSRESTLVRLPKYKLRMVREPDEGAYDKAVMFVKNAIKKKDSASYYHTY